MLDKRHKIIIFVGCFLFFGMFLNIRGVNAEYIPYAEVPVDVGDVLIYDVQYNMSQNYWNGYYKYVVTEISLDSEHSGAKVIKADWYSSEDMDNWCLKEQGLLVGRISFNDVYFDENTIFQHRYFRFDYQPDVDAFYRFKEYILDAYNLTASVHLDYDDSNILDFYFQNDTHNSPRYETWEYRFGILFSNELNVSNWAYTDIFAFKWNLNLENSVLSKLQYNYWGIPKSTDTSFKIGDYFVYDMIESFSETTYSKKRYTIIDFEIHEYYILYLVTIQVWNNEAQFWQNEGSFTKYSEYSLTTDVFYYNEYDQYMFKPSTTNFQDENYCSFVERKNYWDHIYDDESDFDDIIIFDEKSYSVNSTSYPSEGMIETTFRNISYTEQGILKYWLYSVLDYPGEYIYVQSCLNLLESAITPNAPVISTENVDITENSSSINWNKMEEALGYNVYINDTLIGTTTECSYELEFDDFGDYNVTVTGVCNSRESDISNPLIISYSEAPEEPNTNSDPEPDDPSVPGMPSWTIVIFSLVAIAAIFRITKEKRIVQ